MGKRIKSKKEESGKRIEKSCIDPVVTPTLFFIIKNAIGAMIAYFTVELYKKFKKK